MTTRRQMILAAGGGVAVAVAAGLGSRAWQQGLLGGRLDPAYAAWHAFDAHGREGAWTLVKAAVLAPSPHNTQPWLFRISGDSIEILADRARNLGPFDPYRREMHLGLGAAIEAMVIAASLQALKIDLDIASGRLERDPPDDTVPIARLTFGPSTNENMDALGAAIPHRHTNRGAYEPSRELPIDELRRWRDIAASHGIELLVFGREAPREAIDRLIVAATLRIIADPEMMAASDSWFRANGAEILRRRDGLVLDAQGLSPELETAARLLPPTPPDMAARVWLERTREVHLASAPMFGFLNVADRFDVAQTIAAGRAWQRIALSATAAGIATQPINQLPECMDRDRQLGREDEFGKALGALIGSADGITFGFRAGWPMAAAGLSPRRAAEDVVLRQA